LVLHSFACCYALAATIAKQQTKQRSIKQFSYNARMIITIDGPAGAGKSSAARELARRLGFEFLDTGAMYRAVTLGALHKGLDVRNHAAVAAFLPELHIEMPTDHVLLNGENVTGLLRTAEITAASGPVADNAAVRRRLVALQREIAGGRDMVCEGRDQGTVVFPDAACKFFLIADPTERARRRQREMQARGEMLELPEILEAQKARDRRDAERDLAPMKPAKDAVLLDSTALTLTEVVDLMEQAARRCLPGSTI
jgi:cytidylate kinase